jgi:hypothetical protein
MSKICLFAVMVLPRIYMLDWSLTPTELRDSYITSSTELIIPVTEEIVLVGELVGE